MKILNFKVTLEPDEKSGYIVTCPAIPGCYSQGETIDEALKNIRETIELCLEDMKSHKEISPAYTLTS